MGSLKDEKRGLSLREDHQPSDKSENGGREVDSENSAATEGQMLRTSQESTTGEDHQPDLHMNATSVEQRDKKPLSKEKELPGVDSETSDQSVPEQTKNCRQTDVMPLTQKTTATQNDATVSINQPGDGDATDRNDKGKGADNISVAVPSTPDPFDPRSPAPLGQHHMRTQVSLEVVQCHSAATSPMTPPEGGNSFFFPSSFGKSGGVASDSKDAELQVGKQVEFCSVATSPMTPKTPSTTAFPVLVGREPVKREENVRKSEGHNQTYQETKSQGAESEMTESFSSNTSPGSSSDCQAAGSVDSQGTREDIGQQSKQQRMGSMDQDITILVTHHGNNEEEEEKEIHFHSIDPEMVKIEEHEEDGEKSEDRKETPEPAQDTSNSNLLRKQPEEPKDCRNAEQEVRENKGANVEPIDVSGTKPPESPAPFGCHNIRTQVSLEVVQCQSVATSPMTPPEGDQAFYFPSSFGKCGTVTKELQAGQEVEFRSVATAPMTPRTPIATTFPEIKKETSIEEKTVEEEKEEEEEEEGERKQVVESKEEECKEEEKNVEEDKEVINCKEKGEEKCEEPVQEVSWDEKGMTWEVYGAVVEVAVLGSAIQKHLEKQVLKQKQQSSVPPPDPSESEPEGSGKGRARKKGEQDGKVNRRRRNPFRGLMENVQQPHCCSRAHASE